MALGARHDVLRANRHFGVIEVREISAAHVDGLDTEADFAGVDAVEINEPFEGVPERGRVIVAGDPLADQEPRREEAGLAKHEGISELVRRWMSAVP